MDRTQLAERIEAPPGGDFWVKAVDFLDWASQVKFKCFYKPPLSSEVISFEIFLADCRELQMRTYTHAQRPVQDTFPAILVDLRLGTDKHRKPLRMLTDFFGLTISYGHMEIARV